MMRLLDLCAAFFALIMAGWVSAWRVEALVVSTLVILLFLWRRRFTGRPTAVFSFDPDANVSSLSSALLLRDAFAQVVTRLQNNEYDTCRLRVQSFFERPIVVALDLRNDGAVKISVSGAKPIYFVCARRWIADDPMPMTFPSDRVMNLVFHRTTGGRFRVEREKIWPVCGWMLVSCVAVGIFACCIDNSIFLASAVAAFVLFLVDDIRARQVFASVQ